MTALARALLVAAALLAIGWAQPPTLSTAVTTAIPRTAGYFDTMLVDAAEHRLIVSHTGSDAVAFVDTRTGAVVRQLSIGAAHGIAIDIRDGAYFVGTSGAQKGVSVIDRTNLTVIGRIATAGPVDALVLDTKRDRLFADEDDGEHIWVYSAKSFKRIDTLLTPADSDKGEYDPITDRVYQNFTTTDSMLVIDPGHLTKVGRWSTLPATKPHGLAVDAKRRRVYVAGTNGEFVVIDMRTGKVVSSLAIAPNVDQIALDRHRDRVYCASGDGMLSVVDVSGERARLLGDESQPDGAHTLAVDDADGSVWISYGTQTSDYVRKLVPR